MIGGRHSRGLRVATLAAILAAVTTVVPAQPPPRAPVRGLTHAPALASAYDAILDADFDHVPERLRPVCGRAPVWCDVMDAVGVSWRIALDPSDRSFDGRFQEAVAQAITNAEGWTREEPERAEAWFALGAAYGARAQWRVLRKERLGAARDGKRIRESLEAALLRDPELHDAKFGIGMYRYYADVAPAMLRALRWLLLLPGGDRAAGLAQMVDARSRGQVIRGEAEYQLHLIYLWYENRFRDARVLIEGLQKRYPHNPLFALIEAEIARVYFHDLRGSEDLLRALLARAQARRINEPAVAIRRATASLGTLRTPAAR